jgi:hypothetical protein
MKIKTSQKVRFEKNIFINDDVGDSDGGGVEQEEVVDSDSDDSMLLSVEHNDDKPLVQDRHRK